MASRNNQNIVYIPMAADILHPGHLNIIAEGQKLGYVIIGLLTDEAIASYKRVPYMDYRQRLAVIKSLKGVDRVMSQKTLDYRPNLRELKPKYLVHGKDWRKGPLKQARQDALKLMAEWGGELVEPDYTKGVSSTSIGDKIKRSAIPPTIRSGKLKELLDTKKTLRALEAHNGISGIVVENARLNISKRIEEFDAIWISSLTDSIAKGRPDTELVDRTSRYATINEVLEVTTKPIIFDGDTGGHVEHFTHNVRTLERLGVSAVVIEDKNGLKRNSFHEKSADHSQENAAMFSAKIKAGINARASDNFMIIARIESLVLGKNQADALDRAKAYLDAGASAIMIHSKKKSGLEIKKFAGAYNKLSNKMPLMVVPTAYNKITEAELSDWGANIVVYANHLLRAAYPAMELAAQSILKNNRSLEADELCVPIKDFLKIVGGS